MTRSTRNLWVLVGTVAILSLAMSAVVPVLAQGGGTGGQIGQGTSVPLQPGDTLGTLVSRYNLTDANLREFFTLNTDLVLQTGQTVNFPAGIIVNTGAGGQGQGTTGDQTGQATGTPDAGAGAEATGTPDAGAGGTDGATAGDQTYVTQEGDTLGVVLAAMGFTAGDDAGGAGAEGTAPPGEATAAPGEATGTPGAGAVATGTPDAGAGGAGGAQAVTDEQLRDFVSLNSNLSFVSGQTFFLPVGVPETGQGQVTGTPDAGAGGAQATGTPDAGTGAQVTGTPQAGQQTYTVQAGESLTDIANRFGVTLEQLIAANPDLLTAGQTINLPAGAQGAIPQTGAAQSFTVADGDTLGEIVSRYNLSADNMGEFFRANRNLVVTEGQTVNFPAGFGQGGAAGGVVETATPAVVETATPVVVETSTPVVVDTATPVVVETATPTAAAIVETATPLVVETATSTAAAAVETATPLVFETATPTAAAIVETATPLVVETATSTAAAIVETATPLVVETATPTTAAIVETATPVAGAGGQAGQGTTYVTQQGDTLGDLFDQMGVDLDAATTAQDAQMFQQFATQNSDLTFDTGQTVTIPAVIPQTGGQPAGVGAAPSLAEQIRTGQRFGRLCGQQASPGTGHYLIQPGESIFSISEKFNVAVEDIIALNPGVTGFFSGQAIVLPGVEAPGQWNVEQLDESCENWFEGGGGTGTGETTDGGETTGE